MRLRNFQETKVTGEMMMKQKSTSIILLAILMVSSLGLLGAASASASDDWSMFRGNLNHTGASTTAPATTNNVLWQLDTGVPLGSSAAVVDGKVYFGTNDGAVYSIKASDGSQLWKVSLSQDFTAAISSSIAVADGKLYFGEGHEYSPPLFRGAREVCLNATTGEPIWTTILSAVESSAPIADGILTTINAYDNQIYAF
jgi:outer membrane protein assembly factor BamB